MQDRFFPNSGLRSAILGRQGAQIGTGKGDNLNRSHADDRHFCLVQDSGRKGRARSNSVTFVEAGRDCAEKECSTRLRRRTPRRHVERTKTTILTLSELGYRIVFLIQLRTEARV